MEKSRVDGQCTVVLAFGVRSRTTRIESRGKCNEVGLYYLARGKVEREEEHSQAILKQSASEKWERIETGQLLSWIRRVKWRVCRPDGTVNGKKNQAQENRGKSDGETTVDNRRVDNESGEKLRIGS